MNKVVITGAFSFTGKYVTRRLLERGYEVHTLTNHAMRDDPFSGRVTSFPLDFASPANLVEAMRGASTLVNTYWIRFPHGSTTFDSAVANTQTLVQAARNAGVKRIVHVSIANADTTLPLKYYLGKAELEHSIQHSGLSYAILRPTVIFGSEDILINNIAWFARRTPVFGIPGDGQYRIQPIFVEDFALMIAEAVQGEVDSVRDAAGPEIFGFEELVRRIGSAVGRRVRIVRMPASLAYLGTWLTGRWVGDTVLTWEEYKGLMGDLLVSAEPPAGRTRLTEWLAENADNVGVKYASEMARHYRRTNLS